MSRTVKILIHLSFWISITLISFIGVIREQPDDLFRYALMHVLGWVYSMPIFYLTYSILIPKLLVRKKVILFLLVCIACIIISASLICLIDAPVRRLIGVEVLDIKLTKMFIQGFFSSSVVVIISILFRFSIDWFMNQKIRLELINKNQASELALMKSQINPHFLFNTLNNIYSLANRHDDKVLDAMDKLSGIMRYLIYDAQSDYVLLSKEILYLQSYIELQRLRLKNPESVEYFLNGSSGNLKIAPMLLIPLVENAFKHGDRKASKPNIIITLAISGKILKFRVDNTIPKQAIEKDNSTGIGLSNLEKRLDILYNKKYKLQTSVEKCVYKSYLEIELEA